MLSGMKKRRCCFKQTRQINIAPRKISPQAEARQFYCMRGVIRKHPDVSWAFVANMLKRQDWLDIIFDHNYASFGGFSKEEKNDLDVVRYSFRIQTPKGTNVEKELSSLRER